MFILLGQASILRVGRFDENTEKIVVIRRNLFFQRFMESRRCSIEANVPLDDTSSIIENYILLESAEEYRKLKLNESVRDEYDEII